MCNGYGFPAAADLKRLFLIEGNQNITCVDHCRQEFAILLTSKPSELNAVNEVTFD
jgi:hypothetical protein